MTFATLKTFCPENVPSRGRQGGSPAPGPGPRAHESARAQNPGAGPGARGDPDPVQQLPALALPGGPRHAHIKQTPPPL